MTVDEAQCMLANMSDLADEIPEAGEEFAESIMEKSQDIFDTIEEKDHVTEGQEEALLNMHEGLQKWVR